MHSLMSVSHAEPAKSTGKLTIYGGVGVDKIIFKLNSQISIASYGRNFRGVMHISRIRHRRPFRSDECHAEAIRCVWKGARLGGGVHARQKSSSSC